MQYKIPVQIENEDPIIVGLSLRQLFIIMIGCGLGYLIFKWLVDTTGPEIAAAPWIVIAIIFIVFAVFKIHHMTFMQFLLSFIRFQVNAKNRVWSQWVDSFSLMDIGYVVSSTEKTEEKIDFQTKIDKIKGLEEQIKNI